MYWLLRCFKWGRPLVVSLVMASLGLGLFMGLAAEVYEKQSFGFDQTILNALFSIQSPTLTRLMEAITTSATGFFLVPLLLFLSILWLRSHPADIIALVVSVSGAFLLNTIVKTLFERARPTLHPALVHAIGYSFPSGHSQAALAFYGVLAYLIARRLAPQWRLLTYVVAGVWILLVGLSRNYLVVHYPSDVLAAFAVTLPWVLAVIFVHQCHAPAVEGETKVIQPA